MKTISERPGTEQCLAKKLNRRMCFLSLSLQPERLWPHYHLLSTYYMPGTYLLFQVYLFTPYNYTHEVIIFILPMRELRPKRGSLWPRSHSYEVVVLGSEFMNVTTNPCSFNNTGYWGKKEEDEIELIGYIGSLRPLQKVFWNAHSSINIV